MAELKWPVNVKSYAKEKLTHARLTKTSTHPLQGVIQYQESVAEEEKAADVDTTRKRGGSDLIADPLRDDPLTAVSDPLSDPLSSDPLSSNPLIPLSLKQPAVGSKSRRMSPPPPVDLWVERRGKILSKFTTSEKLTLSAGSNKKDRGGGATSSLPEKVRDRLEQLDEMEDGPNLSNLTQAEYTRKMDEMGKCLYEAWRTEQRVKALKLAIQLSKLLLDTTTPQFYPSKFVMISDILVEFGALVFTRLKEKSAVTQGHMTVPLRSDFTPDDVPESAKETASNWFYKIASIRELLPRIYLKLSIIKCNKFLSVGQHRTVLSQACLEARGIGDPLVANYTRCFISRMGGLVDPLFDTFLHPLVRDALFIYPQILIKGRKLKDTSVASYCITFTPAYDWLMSCLASHLATEDLDNLISQIAEIKNNGILLNAILSSLPQQYVSDHVFELVDQIVQCQETAFPVFYLLKNLGEKLTSNVTSCEAMTSRDRKKLLKIVWSQLSTLEGKIDEYMDCALVWLHFICVEENNMKDLDVVLDDIIKHLLPARTFEACYPTLEKMLGALLSSHSDITQLFSLSKFLPFLDLFQKESVKVEACKAVLAEFQKKNVSKTSSAVAVSGFIYIGKALHNSVNALTNDDQKRDISDLINYFISSVSYGKSFEDQLGFYVECRAAFSNLDPILASLVQCVCNLAIDTLNIVKGGHGKKTASFIRGCVAYCYITVPSIHCPFTRLDLYLLSGEVALINASLVQCDSLYKEALTLISELPATLPGNDGRQYSTESRLVDWISRYLSSLLYVPDSPAQTPLHIFRELYAAVDSYPHWTRHGNLRVRGLMLSYLIAVGQPSFSFQIPNVESNDRLYGQNKKYLAQVDSVIDMVLGTSINYLDAIANLAQEGDSMDEIRRLLDLILGGLDVTQEAPYQLLTKVAALCYEGERDFSLMKYTTEGGSNSSVRNTRIVPILTKIHKEITSNRGD